MGIDSVVTFLWQQPNYHTKFTAEHVNVLASMIRRNYGQVDVICVTDTPEGIDPSVKIVPDGGVYANIPNPWDTGFRKRTGRRPSCYRRLRLFAKESAELFGKRFVSIDLDTVITGDMSQIWDRPEDIVLWRDPLFPARLYNGSMILQTAGKNSHVWEDFDPIRSPLLTKKRGMIGSDQAWISHSLGKYRAAWGRADGVYSFRLLDDLYESPRAYVDLPPKTVLPDGARVVFFHGLNNPWDRDVQERYKWVGEHWR